MNLNHFPIQLSQALDGKNGINRANTHLKRITADKDVEAIQTWLAEFAESPHTFRNYQKEVGRLWFWATRWLDKPISSLMREDLLVYEAFLRNPPPTWTDPNSPRHGSQRRLFTGPLSDSSVRQTITILSSMFSYLVAAGYLASNPLALRRRRAGMKRQTTIERYLDQPLWQFVLNFIETFPKNSQREQQHYERTRWLFRLLYGSSLRASEVVKAKASDLKQRRNRWWLDVHGKGNVLADVPISDALMADFGRYREFYGLPTSPSSEDATPLVLPITGRTDQALTTTAIYLMIKKVFHLAAEVLAKTDQAGANKLRQASTHWLRHTSATHQADAGNDIRHIQKNLRHASIETTAIYLHAEDDKRHAQTTGEHKPKEH